MIRSFPSIGGTAGRGSAAIDSVCQLANDKTYPKTTPAAKPQAAVVVHLMFVSTIGLYGRRVRRREFSYGQAIGYCRNQSPKLQRCRRFDGEPSWQDQSSLDRGDPVPLQDCRGLCQSWQPDSRENHYLLA